MMVGAGGKAPVFLEPSNKMQMDAPIYDRVTSPRNSPRVGHRSPAAQLGYPNYDNPIFQPLDEYRLSYPARQVD
jgi:hypothetical protein